MMTLDVLLTAITALSILEVGEIEAALDKRKFALGIGRYSQAKIYLVRHLATGVVAYVGSTIKPLEIRWGGHKGFFKLSPQSVWSKYVFENGGPEQFAIELIEEYPCQSFNELLKQERRRIRELDPVCNVIMRTSVDEMPQQVIIKKDVQTVKYAETLDISEEQYSEVKTDFDLASYQKYWFDNVCPFTRTLDKIIAARIFEGIISDKPKRKQFIWALLSLRPQWVTSLRECPWIKFNISSQDEETVAKMSNLAQDLGLTNVYAESVLPDTKLMINKYALQESLTTLKKTFKLRNRQPKEVNLSTIRLSLGSVLSAFCGAKFVTRRQRHI